MVNLGFWGWTSEVLIIKSSFLFHLSHSLLRRAVGIGELEFISPVNTASEALLRTVLYHFVMGERRRIYHFRLAHSFSPEPPGGRYNLGAKAMICWNWKKEISLQCSSNIARHDTSDTLPASSFPCDCEELTSPSQCIHEISNVSLVTSSIFFPRRYKCSFCLEVTVSSPMSFSLFCQRSASVPLWDLTKFLYVSNVHVIFMGC